jgi:hypothetical protein
MHSLAPQWCTRTFALCALLLAPVAAAQEKTFDLFEVEAGIAGLYGHGFNTFGFGGVSEMKVNINPRWSAGARVDAGIQFAGNISSEFTAFTLAINVATLAKGEFYLTESGIRPFVGLGAGVYWLTLQSVDAGGSGIPSVYQGVQRRWGVAPQLGIDFGGVRLAATYNALFDADLSVTQSVNGTPQNVQNTRNFIALELTFRSFGWSPPASWGAPASTPLARR